MSTVKVRGVVLKETNVGEADKIITVLTKEMGKMSISCKGARKPKSKFLSCTQIFSYCDFVLFQGRGFFSLAQGEPIKIFYNIRNDFKLMSYGIYFLEIVDKTILENNPQEDILKLLLKTLLVMSSENCDIVLVSRVFEIKYFSYLGYMPETSCCVVCGVGYEEFSFFSGAGGGCVCGKCRPYAIKPMDVSAAALHTLNYIIHSDISNLYKFKVSQNILAELSKLTTDYIHAHCDVKFNTLDFIKDNFL